MPAKITLFTQWIILMRLPCPATTRVQGKKSGRTTQGNKQVKSVLTEIAWAASRTKNTFYSARYHKLAARRGKKRAIIAVGHSILKSVRHILSDKSEYRELGTDCLLERTKSKRKKYLKDELVKLGYKVDLTQLPPEEPLAVEDMESAKAV
jgi:hypothetical protein